MGHSEGAPPFPDGSISGVLAKFRRGEADAAGQLVELLYPELRRMAAARLRMERSPHTWDPTVLVHELYLELRKIGKLQEEIKRDPDAEKQAFLGLAAFLMKRLLIQHARPLAKRYEPWTSSRLPRRRSPKCISGRWKMHCGRWRQSTPT